MCISNPIEFQSDTPIIAYKVMRANDKGIQSLCAGTIHQIGERYDAELIDRNSVNVEFCSEYDRGFHAYANIIHAFRVADSYLLTVDALVVKVELSDLTFKEVGVSNLPLIYVANKCKFLEVVEEMM